MPRTLSYEILGEWSFFKLFIMLINNIFGMFIHCITNIFGISWAFGNYINNFIYLLILILKPLAVQGFEQGSKSTGSWFIYKCLAHTFSPLWRRGFKLEI